MTRKILEKPREKYEMLFENNPNWNTMELKLGEFARKVENSRRIIYLWKYAEEMQKCAQNILIFKLVQQNLDRTEIWEKIREKSS